MANFDAAVVGSGPNGLAAAIVLAQAGLRVALYEARETVGGGMRTQELTLPGFKHDVCSAIHPLGIGSPFFSTLPLATYGLEWLYPDAPLAHPLEGGAVVLEGSLAATLKNLGEDARAYEALFTPLVEHWRGLSEDFLGPLLRWPNHPLALARFGVRALPSATLLANTMFKGKRAKALFAGLAAHSILPLEAPATAAFGLVLGMLAHAVGWPFPKGGSQTFADALSAHFRSLGGKVFTGVKVASLEALEARAVLLDIAPKQFLTLVGDRLPTSYRRALERYRYGAGVFKLDYALDGPVPWKDAACLRAGTIHVGGTLPEIAASERAIKRAEVPERPYILVAQQSLFDPGRAPVGKHTLWAYCHVPNGSSVDMTEAVEAQLERFAPGFRARVLARHTMTAPAFETYNPNYVGSDINGGAAGLWQLVSRPVPRPNPYKTPLDGVYLCSASTPPGGGVHGMCGYHAARAALREVFGLEAG